MFTMDKDRKAQVLISEQKDRIAIISEKKESRTQSLKYLFLRPARKTQVLNKRAGQLSKYLLLV